jgi:proteasome accessory factor C
MERGEVEVAEMADRFRMSEDELVADLELASLCGLPPYVDEMVDVFVDNGRIYAGVPRLFTRPLQLTAPEGFALLAAGRAALALPGSDPAGPLARALDKLETALAHSSTVGSNGGAGTGISAGVVGGVAIDLPRPELTETLVDAAERCAVMVMRYWVPSRDEVTERTIVPRSVFTDRGYWYVRADDERSGQERCFRVDRIETLADTGTTVAVRQVPAGPPDWFRDADVERVAMRLSPRATWVAEWFPADEIVDIGDGMLRVTLPVSSEQWLVGLLLRLGPEAQVESPEHWIDRGRAVALRLLDRYRSSTDSS